MFDQLLCAFCIYVHGLVFIFSTSLSQILRYREVLIAVLLGAVVYDIQSFSAPICILQGSEHSQGDSVVWTTVSMLA